MEEDYVGTVCIDSAFWEKFLPHYQFKNSVYGINLKLTMSSLLCGCNIWGLFVNFPEEEGIFVVLTFTVWWFMRILWFILLSPTSHVQQNFIWGNYTWYKTINIVGEVLELPLKVMYYDCCLNEGFNFSVAFELQGDGAVETWSICHHLWQET